MDCLDVDYSEAAEVDFAGEGEDGGIFGGRGAIFLFGAAEGGVSFVNDAPIFGDKKLNAAEVTFKVDCGLPVFGFGVFEVSFDGTKVTFEVGGVEFIFEIFDGGAEVGVCALSIKEEDVFVEYNMKSYGEQSGGDVEVTDSLAVQREDEAVGVHNGDDGGGDKEEADPEEMKGGVDGDNSEGGNGDEDADVDGEGNDAKNV